MITTTVDLWLLLADSLDVIAAVNMARDYHVTIAVYGGGHWPVCLDLSQG